MNNYSYVVVDMHNLAYRSWWPVRHSITSSQRDNSIERGLCSALAALQRRFPSAQLVLAWDGEPQRQRAANTAYKAQRQGRHSQRPADWHERLDQLRQRLGGLYPTLFEASEEADVEIARHVRQPGLGRMLIVSTDRDLLMLLNELVDVLRPGQKPEICRSSGFRKEYGLAPAQYPLYKALVGDRSDNLPGVGRFPTRQAQQLAAGFESVDGLYEALHQHATLPVLAKLTKNQRGKLLAAEGRVRSNVRLMDLLADTQPPHLTASSGATAALHALLKELELLPLAGALIDASRHRTLVNDEIAAQSQPASLPLTRGLPLLPGWADRLAARKQQHWQPLKPERALPLATGYFSERVTLITDGDGVSRLVELAKQRPLAFIGIDFEFCYDRPGVEVKTGHTWQDPRSIRPLLMGLALAEPQDNGAPRLYRFVVDLRCPDAISPLAGLFKLPLPFIAHFGQVELFCLWQLGLPAPAQLWDTWTAERAFQLGLHHRHYQIKKPRDDMDEARAKEAADEQTAYSCKLATTCLRRNVPHPFAADKERLQQSFVNHAVGQPFSREQLDYAAADAEAAARLYPAQVQVATERGCLVHLTTVEMPWTVTNARMAWDGVRVDAAACEMVRQASQHHTAKLQAELAQHGIGNVNSHAQLEAYFRSVGLLDAFRERGKYTFDDDHLEAVEDRHPVVAQIREARKLLRLAKDRVLTGELLGSDGRLHPEHHQLGADSGRNTMSMPNIGGIGKVLRPVVIPEEGYLIGEVDLSQIEVGIAAAVYGDPGLIRMFNGRDVYSAMAKRYYAAELSPPDQELPDKDFKKQHREFRDRMKVFTLATIYNITPFGLSLRLNVSVERAAEEQRRFLDMFPELGRALREASDLGAIRGCAYLCSGLRRWRPTTGLPSSWEVNWLRNTPVQGSAGVVFKAAGNRLYRRYQHYGARLILPMHDAFVFEAPHQHLSAVAELTAEVMRGAVQEYFPELEPQVEINIHQPHCWNKDGQHRSLELWAEQAMQ